MRFDTRSTPDVSVVVPTYYRNDYLRTTLDSVAETDDVSTEIIVVDDSGEGFAHDVVEAYENVEYVRLDENRGAQAARETGLERATGTYVQFLDDDDQLLGGKLAKQVALLENNEDVGVAYCGAKTESGGEALPDPAHRGDVLEYALQFQMSVCSTSTMLIDHDLLNRLRPLNRYPGATDNVMKIRLARLTEFDFVPEKLVYRGEPDWTLGHSLDAYRGRRRILEEFADEYDAYPPAVRANALASTYFFGGVMYVERSVWSPRAIEAFALANYYNPTFDPVYLVALVSSLFGRMGWEAVRRLHRASSTYRNWLTDRLSRA
jgi:glycosyltransferase involved in cell wall biosynthesis